MPPPRLPTLLKPLLLRPTPLLPRLLTPLLLRPMPPLPRLLTPLLLRLKKPRSNPDGRQTPIQIAVESRKPSVRRRLFRDPGNRV
jgi:hypothetical protein